MRANQKRKNTILICIIVFFAVIFVGAVAFLIFKIFSENSSNTNYSIIASTVASGVESTNSGNNSDNQNSNLADNQIDFESLKKQNSEIYAWITIPNTNVDYPILQSATDDNFYLNHDLDKNYSFPGAIYSQSMNSKDFSDRVTVLYGHNMLNGSMFASLHKFEDSDFFEENKYIYVYTENAKLTYEIVSAMSYDDRHIMNSFDFSDDEVYSTYLDSVINPHSISSNVRQGMNLTTDDKLLVLSTCLNYGDENYGNGRYLVQGALVKNEPTK